ncbi:MAG TPA: Hpt domain-containing protein [Candidatus Binataceae bacterium]|nr:Hpt domain-containing protein [Candidatus Binataceae bacterium]
MPDRIIVEVDPELLELVPDFIAHKRNDLVTILDAVSRRDFAAIMRIAHRLKGEGASYGFDAISTTGRSLEAATASRDTGGITTLVRELLGYLDRVEIVESAAATVLH